MTVVVPGGEGVETVTVPAVLLPVRAALPVLTRARVHARAHRATAFWGTAAVLALQLAARGLLLPGLSATGHDTWCMGPLRADDLERLPELAAAMPPEAHAVLLDDAEPLRLPDPERLVHAFLDAVADALPRSPAAALAAGGPAFAVSTPQHLPEPRDWAADVATGHDAGVRLSLRVDVPGLAPEAPVVTKLLGNCVAVFAVRTPGRDSASCRRSTASATARSSRTPPRLWAGSETFGPRARMDALLALRHAARAWAPLTPLLSAAVPDSLEFADDEIAELLGEGSRLLAGAGVAVHWPERLAHRLTARAVIGPPDDGPEPACTESDTPSFLSADALLAFNWRFALGDQQLTRQELDQLAKANRPMVRLRDQWVLVDPEEVRRARAQQDRKVTAVDALSAALTGSTEIDGRAGATCGPQDGWRRCGSGWRTRRARSPSGSPPRWPRRCATTSCGV